MKIVIRPILSASLAFCAVVSSAEEDPSMAKEPLGATTPKKAEDSNPVKQEIKKGYRAAKDRSCEWVKGKLECQVKKDTQQPENAALPPTKGEVEQPKAR